MVAVAAAARSDQETGQGRKKVDFSNVSLRILVQNLDSGQTQLDTRLPAQWMSSVATMVPQLVCFSALCAAQWQRFCGLRTALAHSCCALGFTVLGTYICT